MDVTEEGFRAPVSTPPPFQEKINMDGVELPPCKLPALAAPASCDSPEEPSIVLLNRESQKISRIQVVCPTVFRSRLFDVFIDLQSL